MTKRWFKNKSKTIRKYFEKIQTEFNFEDAAMQI